MGMFADQISAFACSIWGTSEDTQKSPFEYINLEFRGWEQEELWVWESSADKWEMELSLQMRSSLKREHGERRLILEELLHLIGGLERKVCKRTREGIHDASLPSSTLRDDNSDRPSQRQTQLMLLEPLRYWGDAEQWIGGRVMRWKQQHHATWESTQLATPGRVHPSKSLLQWAAPSQAPQPQDG